jgi:photosynthetic reaction center cytochrome c subunit
MVRDMNANWEHVRPSGVSCYNCHRGNNVPLYKWAKAEHEPAPGAILGDPDPWNAQEQTIREFFPQEPYERYLLDGEQIRGLQARQAITSDERMSLHDGEQVYLLMMQMADALNVNCTYCHNSRAFYDWRQGTPMHTAGYYGIEMTVHLNQTYFRDLHEIVPPEREGPLGDAYKPNCMTCHVTQPRPFDGMSWVDQYPGLVGQPAEDPPADASSPVVTVPLAEGGWAPQEPLASPDVGWAPQPSTPDPRP